MRSVLIVILAAFLAALGCGERAAEDQPTQPAVDAAAAMPDDETHRDLAPDASDHGMSINRDVNLPDDIRAAWSGITVRVEDVETGSATTHTGSFGSPVALGDSGLVLNAGFFVPDFVMDDGGITSRSPDPNNPAAWVVISEDGSEDFEGWLFAAMPEIHPFPHQRYRVLLVDGMPAD